jgi:hypothetical protein
VGEPGWLRFRYRQVVRGASYTIDTSIITHGELHLRLHRIEPDGESGAIRAIEGAAALGFPAGSQPVTGVSVEPLVSWVSDRGATVAIAGIQGYRQTLSPTAFGNVGIHSVSGKQLTPLVEAAIGPGPSEFASLVYIGARLDEPRTITALLDGFHRRDDGSWVVLWADGRDVIVPPLV